MLRFWSHALGQSAGDESAWLAPSERHLVTQARALWIFSTASRVTDLESATKDSTLDRESWPTAPMGSRLRKLADEAAAALLSGYFDHENSAMTWWPADVFLCEHGTDVSEARPAFLDLYGIAFAVYGLAAHVLATGSDASRSAMLQVVHRTDQELFDDGSGCWREQATVDWKAPPSGSPTGAGIHGLVSANAHLHWMEALMEVLVATGDASVSEVLGRAVDVVMRLFFPSDPNDAINFLDAEQPIATERSDEVSPGHVVEAAWLLLRAQWLLERTPDPTRFRDVLNWARGLVGPSQTLPYAVDRTGKVLDDSRVWWVQNEWLAAMAHEEGSNATSISRRMTAMDAVASYCMGTLADPKSGVPRSIAAVNGGIIDARIVEPWKVGYHDLRARWIVAGRY